VSAGVDNLVSAADRDFGSVRYFLLDDPLLDDPLLDDPTAAGAALSWLLGRAGLRVPAAGTP